MAYRGAMRRLCLALLLVTACSPDTRGADGSVSRPDSAVPLLDGAVLDGAVPDAAVARDAGGSGDDAGPPPPSIQVCQLACEAAADCGSASPAFDADNYACEGGVCRYTGCRSDDECRATFSRDDYVCRDGAAGVPTCLLGCATAADCDNGTAAFDADNYACEGGACHYTGCNVDAECEATFMSSAYGCFEAPPPSTPLPVPTADRNCVRRCATAADCATDSGAYAAEHYACVDGGCRWTGCDADADCSASLMRDAVCR